MKKQINFRKYLLIFLISFVVSILITPIRGGYVEVFGLKGFPLATIVYSVVYFVLTIWILYKYRSKLPVGRVIAVILVGAVVFEIPTRILLFESSMVSSMDFFVRIVAIFAGWAFVKIEGVCDKTGFTMIFVAMTLWSSVSGVELLLHKYSFGTFSGSVDEPMAKPIEFLTTQGDSVKLTPVDGKYIVLDFFTTTCGVCFREFPYVQEIHDKYANDTRVKVVSVHVMGKNETTQCGSELLRNKGYTIPCLSIDRENDQLPILGVKAFPTVLIYDTAGKIIFRGSIERAQSLLDDWIKPYKV